MSKKIFLVLFGLIMSLEVAADVPRVELSAETIKLYKEKVVSSCKSSHGHADLYFEMYATHLKTNGLANSNYYYQSTYNYLKYSQCDES